MPKSKPMKVGVYVILDAKRQAPANFEIPGGLPPLMSVGDYVELPQGAPKGAFIHSIAYTGSPVEDIYTVHFVATASVSYAGDTPTLVFEPEAEALFELIALGVTARSAGKELTDSVLKQVSEVVANESKAGALAWIAEQRRQVARSR